MDLWGQNKKCSPRSSSSGSISVKSFEADGCDAAVLTLLIDSAIASFQVMASSPSEGASLYLSSIATISSQLQSMKCHNLPSDQRSSYGSIEELNKTYQCDPSDMTSGAHESHRKYMETQRLKFNWPDTLLRQPHRTDPPSAGKTR